MEHISEKVEQILAEIQYINITIAKQEENLKQHMYRTELAEQRIQNLEEKMEPLRNKLFQVEGIIKFLGIVALLVSIIAGVSHIIKG
jgi:hypothetical protein